jgi:hypothetical protein
MSKRLKQTNTFEATSDGGDTYTIIELTTIHEIRNRRGYSEVPGSKELQTAEGHAVNRREKGIYEIVNLGGLIVRSSDSNAS